MTKKNEKDDVKINRILLKGVSKSYDGRPVLRDVNLYVDSGEVIGLLGPNGAGKTTCFYTITGMITPDSGQIFLNEEDITDFPMYKRARLGISYLPQEPSIFRGLSVEDNIMAVLEIVEPYAHVRNAKLNSLLSEFSISHLRKVNALKLSGGERRRLEIARALATNPKFICLDEPLAGIDPLAIKDIGELILQLKYRNIGVLITDHNVRDTLSIVDRAYVLTEGKIFIEGTPAEIIHNSKVREVYLGDAFKTGV